MGLFGTNDDTQELMFGAIKTPKFYKKNATKTKEKKDEKIESAMDSLFDLSDIFGDDDDAAMTGTIEEGAEYFSDYTSSSDSSSDPPSPSLSSSSSSSSSSSPSPSMPDPKPSQFEIEQKKLKKEEAEWQKLSAEIEEDLLQENEQKIELEKLQKKRATEIMQDMNDLFDLSDDDSFDANIDYDDDKEEEIQILDDDDNDEEIFETGKARRNSICKNKK